MNDLTLHRRVCTPRQFVAANPGRFTLRQIQHWIFRGADNGTITRGVTFRPPGVNRWYLDVDRFEEWLTEGRVAPCVRRYFSPTSIRPAVAAAGRK